jgi:ATP/maltotriose-dependent transcriptional regulator MalT
LSNNGNSILGLDPTAALVSFPDIFPPRLSAAATREARRTLREAWRALLALDFGQAFARTDLLELGLNDLPARTAAELRHEIGLLRAAALALQDDGLAALPIAAAILKESPDGRCAPVARTLCRFGHWKLGDLDGFYALPRVTLSRSRSRRRGVSAVLDLAMEAAVAFEQLRIGAAKRLALDAMELAETLPYPDTAFGLPAGVAAQVAYEQGHLDEAEGLLNYRLPAIKAHGDIESALRAYSLLSRIATQRGRHELAMLLLREAEALGTRRSWPRLVAASVTERVMLLIDEGRLDEAESCSKRLTIGASRIELHRYAALVRARLALARAPSPEPLAVLRELRHDAFARRDFRSALELSILLVDALALLGLHAEAATLLLQVLDVGYAAGLYQVFIDGGPRMGPALTLAYELARNCEPRASELLAYIDSLFARWRPRKLMAPPTSAGRSVGLMSPRERDILRLFGLGLSNKQIAQTLKICPETVKSHVKRIFVKLEVKTRAEAVSRAGSLGMV